MTSLQKSVLILLLSILFGMPAVPVRADAPLSRRPGLRPACIPQEILIRIKQGANDDEINRLHRRFGGNSMRRIEKTGIHRVRFGKGVDIDRMIKQYRTSDLVMQAERHALRYPQADVLPNDTFYSGQWAVDTADARKAWSIRQTERPVVVAVIDTGIDYSHPDLQNSIWINAAEKNGVQGFDDDGNGYVDDVFGWDFADNDADPMDYNGHGTHVAGIIGAMGDNGTGIAGICWNIRLMPLKVTGDNSSDMNSSDILEAIEYARESGVTVFNCSFGGSYDSVIEYEVFRSLQQNGGLVICAAGNAGVDIDLAGNAMYPARYDLANIIAVAASGQDGAMADFSSYGSISVDLMAPGVDILSTRTVTIETTDAKVTGLADGTVIAASGMSLAGTTGPEGVAGMLYDCGYGALDEIPDAVSGNIALVQRGSLYFSEKVANVQAKGAIGVIIYNNVAGSFDGTLATPVDWIPAVSVSAEDGEALCRMVGQGVCLINHFVDNPNLYHQMSGTSMATPYVSGLVALMRARQPKLGSGEIRSAILGNAVFDQSAAGKTVSGGRVNLYSALGEMLTPGDITGDDRVELDDLITCLQLLSGIPPRTPILLHPRIDINGDGRIGLEESIYILDHVSH